MPLLIRLLLLSVNAVYLHFGEQYHIKVLSDDGLSSLTDYFNLGTDAKRDVR